VVGGLATEIYGMSSHYICTFWEQHWQDEHIVSEMYSGVHQQWWRISTSKPVDGKFVTVFFDVTEYKNAENALHQSERNYRTLLEQIPAIVYIDDIVDGRDRGAFISPQIETIMDVRVDDWLRQGAQSWINHQHPEDRAYVNSMYKDFLHNGGVYDCEYRMVRDDGRIVWFHDKAVIIEASENGGARQAHGVIYDVTRQKQVDAELRQRLKELETLYTISVTLRMAQSLEVVLPRLLDETLANMETNAGEIMLYDPVAKELYVAVARGWHTQLSPASIKPGEGVSGQVFLSGKMYYSRELSQDPLVLPSARERIPAGWNGICLPIRTGEDVVGVWFVSLRLPQQFSPEQLRLLESLAEMAGAAIHRIRLHEETVQRLENLQALHEVDLAINSNFDLRPTLDIVIEHAVHQLKVDAVDILLLRKGLQTLEYVAGQGFRTPINKGASMRIGESCAGRVALERRTLYIGNPSEVQKNPLFSVFWKSEGFVSYYCVPLIAKGEVKGVMEVFSRRPMLDDAEWMYYLETLSGQAAIAIDNTQLFENLQQANLELGVAYEATIEGWSRALDLRDHETEGHTQRVTEMTIALASQFNFTQLELLAIRRGAILHDIGKISVPDSILHKTGPLSEEEWSIVRRHPQAAYEMLKPIHYLHDSLDIPYCHHEKWDGTGYPRGLAGENIPLTARIFAVMDVYDALSTPRPYREAWPKQKVLEYIRECSGTHFDPQVVEVFLRLFSNNL
jgi:PAS domain S-box-containing protein